MDIPDKCRQEKGQRLQEPPWAQLGSILLCSAGLGDSTGLACWEEAGREVLHISKFLCCCPRS